MKVRATAMGQYKGSIKEIDDVFEIQDEPTHRDIHSGQTVPVEFSSAWMVKVEEKPAERRQDEDRSAIDEQLKAEEQVATEKPVHIKRRK